MPNPPNVEDDSLVQLPRLLDYERVWWLGLKIFQWGRWWLWSQWWYEAKTRLRFFEVPDVFARLMMVQWEIPLGEVGCQSVEILGPWRTMMICYHRWWWRIWWYLWCWWYRFCSKGRHDMGRRIVTWKLQAAKVRDHLLHFPCSHQQPCIGTIMIPMIKEAKIFISSMFPHNYNYR